MLCTHYDYISFSTHLKVGENSSNLSKELKLNIFSRHFYCSNVSSQISDIPVTFSLLLSSFNLLLNLLYHKYQITQNILIFKH